MNSEVNLVEKFKSYDWFHSIGQDQYGRSVIYTNYLNKNVFELTNCLDSNTLVHLSGSLLANKDHYIQKSNYIKDEFDANDVYDQLFVLEEEYGVVYLEAIFFEIHDKDNSITNYSAEYPELRNKLERIYDKYGFDLIFEFLDLDID